ncbi:MAG: fibronectin type III domain-containing protein, partial [Bacteroidales bacterium]|nr:fibronectin type III domain-containing protein [Bacteroidales bacterium]
MKKVLLSLVIILFSVNISYSQTTQEYVPFGLNSGEIDINNATLSWRNNSNADFWQLVYQAALAEEQTLITLTDTIVSLSDLSPNTRYIWKVRMVDIDGDTSLWSAENYFYTLSDDTLCPRVADFFLGYMDNNLINVQWQPAEGTDTWQIVCGEV